MEQAVTVRNIRVGRREVKPSTRTHFPGIRQRNARGHYEKSAGHLADGRSTARRPTGISSEARNPIDPRMPNPSPA